MELNTDEVMAVATLVSHPGFDLLVKILREQEELVLTFMSQERDEKDIVYLTRFWQVLKQVIDIIASKPQEASTEIEDLLVNGQLDPALEFCRHERKHKNT